MNIGQTDQLILLIMNSALMTLLSSALLGGTWLRQNSLLRQLTEVRSHYHHLTRQQDTVPHTAPHPKPASTQDLKQLRARRTRLNQQYQWSRVGTALMHMAVLIFSVSLFTLTLRSLLAFDRLIPIALFLFALGAAGVLTGIACLLVDFASDRTSGYSLGQTFASLLSQIAQQWKRRPLSQLATTAVTEPSSLPTGVTQERSA
ncbi:MAG: hypothetical protein AAFV85_26050 [Cyanobacteria bacterium J06634_6]